MTLSEFSLGGDSSWGLPSNPDVVRRLLALCPLAERSLPDVLAVVRWDPALSARLVFAANRTKFGQCWPVGSLERAALLLEDVAVKILSLQFTLVDPSAHENPLTELRAAYWRQSRIQAVTAQLLGGNNSQRAGCDLFLAGLLMDLGRLVLLQAHPEPSRRVQEVVRETARPWDEVEQELLGQDHVGLGVDWLLQGTFPAGLIDAVKVHHHALPAPRNGPAFPLGALLAVAAAMGDYLLWEERPASASRQAADRLKQRYETFFQASGTAGSPTEESLETLIHKVRQQLTAAAIPSEGSPPTALALLTLANQELGRLGLEAAFARGQAQTRARQAEQSLEQYEHKISTLEQQALRDPLTGVYNRRFLIETLHKEVARCCRYAQPLGLLFVDVDGFKSLNDTWGHLVGDLVLHRVAETLEAVLRTADVLARFGGEEFVILPTEPNEHGLVLLAERLRVAVEQLAVELDEGRVSVTVSVGCTLTLPTRHEADLAPQLLAAADAAMYEAKHLGRNRVVFRSLLEESERELMQKTIDRSFSRWLVRHNVLSQHVVEQVLLDYLPERMPLGELAIDTGVLTDDQVARILERQDAKEDRFGTLALEQRFLTQDQLAGLLARQRENPIQLARLLIHRNVLEETRAVELVKEYLQVLCGQGAAGHKSRDKGQEPEKTAECGASVS